MTRDDDSRGRSERGAIAVTAIFFVMTLCGLSFALLTQVVASKKVFDRGEANLRAFEAAEAGVVRAEEEISSRRDSGADGIGNLTGVAAGATYAVVATQDPVLTDQWTLRARGAAESSGRQIEVRVQRVVNPVWNYAMFAQNPISLTGGVTTDSFDSRLGTYASQATKSDAFGTYAKANGPVGSNAGIIVSKSEVRGDATAGPGYTTTLSGTGTVTGSMTALTKAVAVPDTPLATFLTAATVNDNGAWTTTGGTTYNPITKTLTVSTGNTVTLTKSTYFFSKIILSGGSTLKINSGPIKIYITDQADFSGGSIVNATEKPSNLQFYQQPYALPVGYLPTVNSTTLSGGGKAAFTFYGPKSTVTVSGAGDVSGAIIAKTINPSGASRLHYDVALQDEMDNSHASIRRIYWRDVAPPTR